MLGEPSVPVFGRSEMRKSMMLVVTRAAIAGGTKTW